MKDRHIPADRCLPRNRVATSHCHITKRTASAERWTAIAYADANWRPWTPFGTQRPLPQCTPKRDPIAPDLGLRSSKNPRSPYALESDVDTMQEPETPSGKQRPLPQCTPKRDPIAPDLGLLPFRSPGCPQATESMKNAKQEP